MVEHMQHSESDVRNYTGGLPGTVEKTSRRAGEEAGSGADVSGGERQTCPSSIMKVFVTVVLGLWLALVLVLGAVRGFVTEPGTPPYPIAIAVVAPVIVFLAALRLSAAFRSFVLAGDLPLITAVQAWRFAGFGFLALYAHGVLPGMFAWPAGLGDMAIGLTAPWVALALGRRSGFAASRLFVAWNLLGILDLVDAVSSAAINQTLVTGAAGEVTVAPMALLPLLLIPAYLVPLFVMLHLAALFQARRPSGTPAWMLPATA